MWKKHVNDRFVDLVEHVAFFKLDIMQVLRKELPRVGWAISRFILPS
jgi:hypothetical protein